MDGGTGSNYLVRPSWCDHSASTRLLSVTHSQELVTCTTSTMHRHYKRLKQEKTPRQCR
jgi:hypothetical protein